MFDRSAASIPTPRELARAAFRHRRRVGLFVAVTLLTTAAVIVFYPRKYASEAQLFVRVGRESVALDPTATTGQTVGIVESRESEINSVVEMIQGRAVIEKTVDALGPHTVLQSHGGEGGWLLTSDPKRVRAKAIEKVEKSLDAWAKRHSSVITLRYLDGTPELAQRITDQLLTTYIAEHLRINRTAGSQEFFDEQTKLKHAQWRDATARLRDAKNELGLVSVEAQRKLLEAETARLDEQLVLAGTAQIAAETKARELAKIIAQLPARVVTQQEDGHPNAALDGMRGKLYELELKERELAAKLTEDHPQLIAVRQQVQEARGILETQDERRTRHTTAANPARERLQEDLLLQQAEARALAAKSEKLNRELARVQQKVKHLNAIEGQIAALEQEATLAQRNYLTHAENLELARIDRALEDDRISNVNIIQPASLELRPASPNKKLVAALGLAIAVLGSIAVVIVSEQIDESLQTPDDVERQLEMPVLVSLPHSRRHPFAASPN